MLSRAGCARVVLRGDTEPAMVALRAAFGRHLARHFGTDGVPQDSSLGFVCRQCSCSARRKGDERGGSLTGSRSFFHC